MQGRHGDGVDATTALNWFSDALNELGEHAKQHNVPLIYEPLNRYETNICTTVEAGLKLIAGLTTSNVVLLADLFSHLNIEETNICRGLAHLFGKYIGHVHFVDSNRRPAGLGHIDYVPIAKALSVIGYKGYASAEAFCLSRPRLGRKTNDRNVPTPVEITRISSIRSARRIAKQPGHCRARIDWRA